MVSRCLLEALCALLLCAGGAGGEEWSRIDSGDAVVAIEYSKGSVQRISPTHKRARTRFVSKSGGELPLVQALAVVSETEYYCPQPLEKVLWAEVVSASGVARETVPYPVYSEIERGSNSYRLWLAVCAPEAEKAP